MISNLWQSHSYSPEKKSWKLGSSWTESYRSVYLFFLFFFHGHSFIASENKTFLYETVICLHQIKPIPASAGWWGRMEWDHTEKRLLVICQNSDSLPVCVSVNLCFLIEENSCIYSEVSKLVNFFCCQSSLDFYLSILALDKWTACSVEETRSIS